jgi:uncharacterized delta-60 repeat protein
MILLFLCWPLHNRVQAAAGDLDPTFGVGGIVVTEFFGGLDQAAAVLIQPDGRIIAVGSVDVGMPNANFGLARYNTDGSLDASFGGGGKVVTDFFGSIDFAFDAVLQPDGKIVVAGQTSSETTGLDFALARYNSDGSLDASFGRGGKVTTDFFGDFDEGFSVALQPDGKIIVAGIVTNGSSENTDFGLARYNSDGSLDTSFGNGGKVTTDFFGSLDQAFAVAVQPDGKIVLAGGAVNNSRFLTIFALARYNADGSLDATFGSGGRVTTSIGTLSEAFDIVIQPDAKIIAAGGAVVGDGSLGNDFALARYNVNGSLDTSFGTGGVVTLDIGGRNDQARGVVLQQNGKIVAAGGAIVHNRPDLDIALARFNSNGSVDTSFGTNGKVTTDFVGTNTDEDLDTASAVAIQPDGKIVIAGITMSSDLNQDFILARYLGDEVGLFDVCLQDDSNGNILQLNLTTGDYRFTRCGGLTLSGTGALTKKGSTITLQHNAPDRRVLVRLDTGINNGTASLQHFSSGMTFTIIDRNTANNSCSCP